MLLFEFFFHAEDGIRATSVTGVQTCALPISLERLDDPLGRPRFVGRPLAVNGVVQVENPPALRRRDKIGRASCRERESLVGVGVAGKTKGLVKCKLPMIAAKKKSS